MSSNMLDIALGHIARGWAPTPVKYRTKEPDLAGWPEIRITAETAPRYFNGAPSNVGVITGSMSNGLTDIDLDCREAVEVASFFLPSTRALFGRESAPAAHWLYRTTTDTTRVAWRDTETTGDKGILLELRHDRHQSVFPGSTHQDTGELIRWEAGGDGEPAEVDADDLLKRCRHLAAAALLARCFPDEGSRDDVCLMLGGFLHRAGLTPGRAEVFIEAVARAGGSDAPATRARKGATVRPGKNLAGFPQLEKWIGTKRAKAVAEWLGYPDSTTAADDADTASQSPWPAPDTSLLAPERPPAPEFPGVEVFGPVWGRWLLETAECKSAPPDYVAAGLLSTASSLIGNARWATPWDGWSEPPAIWSMLIGLPSAGKSPGQDATVAALRAVERRIRVAAGRDHAEWTARAETAKLAEDVWKASYTKALRAGKIPPEKPASADPGPEPHIPRLAASDVTLERLCQLIAKQPKGVLMLRDEIAGWLTNMSRYSGGDDRGFWIEAYGGRPYPLERVSRVTGTIDRLLVTVVGGIQPDRLRSLLLKTDDDGMPSRFIPFWPDPVPLRRPRVPPDEDLPERAFTRLDGLGMPIGADGDPRPWFVPFSEPARALLHEFRVSLGKTEASSSGMLQSFIGKMPGLAVRLSLVLAALDWSVGEPRPFPSEITVDHLGRAAHFIEAYVIPMARRTYNETSVPVEEQAGRALAKMIVDEGWRSFTSRQVQLKKRVGLRDKREIDAALNLLVSAAWIVAAPEPTNTKPRRSYSVNPGCGGRYEPMA